MRALILNSSWNNYANVGKNLRIEIKMKYPNEIRNDLWKYKSKN